MKNFIKRVCQGIPGILLCFLVASSVEAAHPELNDGQQPTSRIRQRKRKATNIPEDAEQPQDKKLKQESLFEEKCKGDRRESRLAFDFYNSKEEIFNGNSLCGFGYCSACTHQNEATALVCNACQSDLNAFDQSFDPLKIPKNIIGYCYKEFISKFPEFHAKCTPTMAYLDRPELLELLKYHDKRIVYAGIGFFKSIFFSMLMREVEFNDSHKVFYHGLKRNFMLFQDLYQALSVIKNKKQCKDFICLRVPHHSRFARAAKLFALDGKFPCNNFSTFTTIQEFLKYYLSNGSIADSSTPFDGRLEIGPQLLSVNASLFGGDYCYGESSFKYFLGSVNYLQTDMLEKIKDLFEFFDCKPLFFKYAEEFKILDEILGRWEVSKTGILCQIFIPENRIDELAYRCMPLGRLDWEDDDPNNHSASKDLNDYVSGVYASQELDEVQFRLLMNKEMLDSDRGIKIFRYCNEETIPMRLYREKLGELVGKIAADIEALPEKTSQPYCLTRLWNKWRA